MKLLSSIDSDICIRSIFSTFFILLLASCTIGQSAPAPTNVQAVAGDSSITVTWDMVPGVDYLLYAAPMAGVSPQNCSSTPACQTFYKATSPLVIPTANIGITNAAFTINGSVIALTNGTLFSISIDGRTNGGPGGPGSTAVSVTPRLAGSTWTAGTVLPNDLRGITNGTATVAGLVSNIYVAVGANGGLYSSLPGKAWTTITHPLPTSTLNGVASYSTNFIAVGAAGEILLSNDAITWTPQTSNTTHNLNAIASNGANFYVAVGDNGTIITSSGGAAWTVVNSGTTNALYGVTYDANNFLYIAVGAAGTLLTSTDTITWTAKNPATSADLKGVAYGGYTISNGIGSITPYTFAVVGTAGTLITSTDGGLTWVVQPAISGINLNAITYGHQFIAAGASGTIYTSTDGMTWTLQTSGTTNDLFAIAHGRFDYLATGSGGVNLYSK
jgi:photosystem II stability/assembly factor-like uncharacterized protein